MRALRVDVLQPEAILLQRSELVAPQAAVDRNNGAGDIAGQRRGQKAHEICYILRLAVAADGNLVVGLPLPLLGRVIATDLLRHDAPRRQAIDRDAVLADLPRQTFGP